MPLHKKYVTDSVKIKLPSVDIFVYEYALSFVKHTHTHTPFNGPLSGTTRVSQYQKGKTNLVLHNNIKIVIKFYIKIVEKL